MRLYNIYRVSKELIGDLATLEYRLSGAGRNGLVRWSRNKEKLANAKTIPIYRHLVEKILKSMSGIEREESAASIAVKIESSNILKSIKELMQKAQVVVDLYESLELTESKLNQIEIKMPHSEELKDFVKNCDELNFIVTQCPYLWHEKEQIKFSKLDVGSEWLILMVVGTAAASMIIKNLGKIVQTGFKLRSQYLSIKIYEEVYRQTQQKTEVIENSVEVFETLKKYYLDEAVKTLKNDMGELKDGEEEDKVKRSLDKMALLIDKGMEIHTSIDVPKDVRESFLVSEGSAIDDKEVGLIANKHKLDEK